MRPTPALLLALCALLASSASQAEPPRPRSRPGGPHGRAAPASSRARPPSVVAFRYQGGWLQIPVQIDERDTVTFNQVYGGGYPQGDIDVETYTDAGTYVGADSDPLFDEDDELVFMAKDAGSLAPGGASLPAGVVPGSGLRLRLDDPLDAAVGFVYLFETNGSLSPGAGADYVSYSFDLLAGSYPADYDLANGPNPEDSLASSALYETHFSDRWIRDETKVHAGSASGVDILDRHKNLFAPGVCQRSEDTFSDGEGAFFANIDGPVRGIRSYMGANSGPLTQRLHLFYEGRQDVTTFLRVHAIPGMLDMYDYSPAASGMTYYNSLNTGGVSIDGVPDTLTAGLPLWEMVTGAQGTLVITAVVETDIDPFLPSYYYNDDTTPSEKQCTGDDFEYGQSGTWMNFGIPNTDPSSPPFYHLAGTRIVYYDPPGATVPDAEARAAQALTPLVVTVGPLSGAPVPALAPTGLLGLAALLLGVGAAALRRAATEGA